MTADRPATEPRTAWDDPTLYPFDGMLPQCGYVVHWAHCRLDAGHNGRHSPGRLPAEAASPSALDVERLAEAMDEHIETDCPRDTACDGSCAPLIEAIYSRLSPQERRDKEGTEAR